jgi:hypothetical protein
MRCGGKMRLIKTYLLRLYADTDASERICGDIRPLDEDQSYPFKNMDDLAFHLHQLVLKPSPATPKESGES